VTHKRTHTGEKPHKCTQCDYTSTTSGNISSHVRAMHATHHQRIMKKKETRVCNYLTEAGFCLEREIVISYKCFDTNKSFSKIDAVLEYPGRDLRVLLEVDETQHKCDKNYGIACDVRRMNDTGLAIRLLPARRRPFCGCASTPTRTVWTASWCASRGWSGRPRSPPSSGPLFPASPPPCRLCTCTTTPWRESPPSAATPSMTRVLRRGCRASFRGFC